MAKAQVAETESRLDEFEGHAVTEVGVEMPNAAGGLQEAMAFEPVEWEIADEGYVVLHYIVKKVRHEPIVKDDFDGALRRVHVLHVDEAAPIDAALVTDVLTEQRERIRKAKEDSEGILSLDLAHRNDDLGDELSGDGGS